MRKTSLITLAVIIVITMVLTLTACANGNTVAEATPEPTASPTPEPTTSQTPEPTPEPEEPPHEHIWQEANYQQPQMCIECGETEGEPIPPRFEEYGFTLSEHGIQVPYLTVSFDGNSSVIGQITVVDYDVFDYAIFNEEDGLRSWGGLGADWRTDLDFDHIAEVTRRANDGDKVIADADGEWRYIVLTVDFTAENKGFRAAYSMINYYSLDLSGLIGDGDGGFSEPDTLMAFTLNYNGNDYESWVYHRQFGDSYSLNLQFYVFVPVGYDGMMLAFMNRGNFSDNPSIYADIIDEDTVFFRVG